MQVTISKSNYTFVDVSSWLDKVGRTYANAKMTMWAFVMTLAAGIDQFGRNDPKREELYELASHQLGLTIGTLKTYVSAARSPIASLAIEKDLTFQHARAVLGLPEDVADSLLSDAVANGWSAERLSQKAWVERNGPPSQRTLTGNTPPPAANGIAHQPGRTMSPPSAYAPHNGYHATDDIDERAEYLAAAPDAYDASDDEPPFTNPHSLLYDDPNSHDGYVWDAQGECWRPVDEPSVIDSLWPDERIAAIVDDCACDVEYTDADGYTHTRQYVAAEDVQRLLRTMRDEFEAVR